MIPFSWPRSIYQQYLCHTNADFTGDDFLKRYTKKFERTRIGTSFAPELLEQIYALQSSRPFSLHEGIQILSILIKLLKIQDIRLGFRWNRCVSRSGKVDISYYQPYLDYCISHKIRICLNVGPIKTFGWPEEHIPEYIVKKSHIKLSEIEKISYEYIDELLSLLREKYSIAERKYISLIQPENEPFYPFGKYKFLLSSQYVSKIIAKCYERFPHSQILLNASEIGRTTQIISIMSDMENIPFRIGVNYYHNVPGMPKVWKVGPVDSLTIAELTGKYNKSSFHKMLEMKNISFEVTEAQFEQWGRQILSPGNSLHEFEYVLLRCIYSLLNTHKGGIIRLWGTERLGYIIHTQKMHQDHKDIVKIIQNINS